MKKGRERPDDNELPLRLVRTMLFVPASRPRAIEKARTLDCDFVILDLEDSVLPEDRDQARQTAVEAVSADVPARSGSTAKGGRTMDWTWSRYGPRRRPM
jgi:citrate lyase beta subunit